MRFWDSSALLPLLVEQEASNRARGWLQSDPAVMVWWSARVECASAVERLAREGLLAAIQRKKALELLERMASEWDEMEAVTGIRETALRFLRVHPLRTADALQLAAAFTAAEQNPPSLEFVCLDQRLIEAAEKEGFQVLK